MAADKRSGVKASVHKVRQSHWPSGPLSRFYREKKGHLTLANRWGCCLACHICDWYCHGDVGKWVMSDGGWQGPIVGRLNGGRGR